MKKNSKKSYQTLSFWLLSASLLLLPSPLFSQGKTITYGEQNGKAIKGFIAYPKSKATAGKKLPALILIHEWWGLNDDIKRKAATFAEEGYVALAVDLYGGKSTTKPAEARELAGAVRKDMQAAFANLEAAVDYLKKDPLVNPQKIASLGWCFGGGWSYQMAKNNLDVVASIIYYGFFNPQDDLQQMRALILGHFADKDRAIKIDNVKEFQAKLKTLNGDHEIYIYPNTQHGFASREGENPNYNSQEAAKAWERTLDFLNRYVKK